MKFKTDDLQIEVGTRAYQLYKGIETKEACELYLENKNIRFGVYIKDMTTGEYVYENSEISQIKNMNKALEKLKEMIGRER